MRGLFVTGTDTGIGKTTICTGLLQFLHSKKLDAGVMKPFATSERIFSHKFRSEDSYRLALAAGNESSDKQINPFFYKIPTSPLIASRITHQKLPSLNHAVAKVLEESKRHQYMIIEGIGGIMVPITRRYTIAAFAKQLGLPVVVVASAKLGTLNHILLTLEVCSNYNLNVVAIIINMMPRRPEEPQRLLVSTVRTLTGIKATFAVPESDSQPDPKSIGSILNKKWQILNSFRI
ncbi:MAG TPA: dethiobiotin synthase [Nitrososphaeraceae archaeon]|jgi:dethiobiotin synthetase